MSQDFQTLPSFQPRSLDLGLMVSSPSASSSIKRRASSSFEYDDNIRKRLKEDNDCAVESTNTDESANNRSNIDGGKLVDEMIDELQCGCCSGLVYKPVLVIPCQHFFCGSCCVMWIRNGGTTCPVCRTLATVGMPFRAIQPLIDSLVRTAPHKARAERERQQADEVYKFGQSIRFPPPREASPPTEMDRSTDYIHPCPHCLANNPYDWRCPQPLSDPANDPDNAWPVDDGVPPGHAHCGNCENLMALQAPSSSRCDFCNVAFCGIGIQERCVALPLLAQQPHNLSSHPDLILSSDIYECFDGNTVEVEILLEYVDSQRLTPRHIYRDMMTHLQKSPTGFQPLFDLDLFSELHAVSPSRNTPQDGARTRICRLCAAEIFFWGLKDWWIRERKKGFVEERVMNRKDCPDGRMCNKQQADHAHAREFNHVFPPTAPQPNEASTSNRDATPPPDMLHDTMDISPPRLAASSSAASLSFLLNADDVGGQSTPPHRASVPDLRDDLPMA